MVALTTTVLILAVLAALGGGALGAAMGALPSFIFAGFLAVAGAVIQTVGYQLGLAGVTDQIGPSFYVAAFGPLFGPQVGFAGGCAAHAYAAKHHPEVQSQDGWGYHDAKNIAISLGTKPDILVVGALFGAFGEILKLGTDYVLGQSATYGFAHIAWIVVVSAIVHRVVFGYPIVGDREKVVKRLLSGTETDSVETGESTPTEEPVATDGAGRTTTSRAKSMLSGTSWFSFDYDEAEPHLSHQFEWSSLFLGGLIGLVSGYVTIVTHNPWLMFGISAATLIFLEFDSGGRGDAPLAGMPVTHHISLPASVAALAALSIGSLVAAMVWAAIFGVLGEFFHHVGDRLFYSWGDTHLDPPAFSIMVTIFILTILSVVGVLGPNAFQAEALHLY